MTAAFITATGTDIGKTFVTCGLIRHFQARGEEVEALKPIVTGFDATEMAGSDPGLLLKAMGRDLDLAQLNHVSPWRFAPAFSPDLAARLEKRTLDFEAVVGFCKKAVDTRAGALLIEGVGGIMVPLDDRHTVLDWMVALDLPLVLVAGSYLGAISHALSALYVLQHRNLKVATLVISETPNSSVPLDETARIVGRFAAGVPLIALPRLETMSHPRFAEIAHHL
jgi:dethiobiotin synthetase